MQQMSGDIEKLFEELREEASKREHSRRLVFRAVVPAMVIIVAVWLGKLIFTGEGTSNLSSILPLLSVSIIVATVYSQRHKSLVAEIAARKDPRILGELLEATQATEEDVRKLAESAIPDILGIWLSGENELEPAHRGYLYRLLDDKRPIELVEACLIAVRAIGGVEAVPYLESLQRRTDRHQKARWQRLSTKCLETLADVRMREARRIISEGPMPEEERIEQSA